MTPRRLTVRGIIYQDGQLLVTKFKQDDGSESKYWGTFGGGLDLGESLQDGLHREMIEETGIIPKIGKLLFIQQYADDEGEYLEFFFHIANPEDYATIDLASTSHGDLELTRSAFVNPKETLILPAFLQTIDVGDAIENNRPVYIYNELQ